MDRVFKVVGVAVLAVISIAGGILLRGALLLLLWNWFIPEMGGPAIKLPVAVGLPLVFSALEGPKESDEPQWVWLVALVFVGFIVQSFV